VQRKRTQHSLTESYTTNAIAEYESLDVVFMKIYYVYFKNKTGKAGVLKQVHYDFDKSQR